MKYEIETTENGCIETITLNDGSRYSKRHTRSDLGLKTKDEDFSEQMERLTNNEKKMICKYENCLEGEDICPLEHENKCNCLRDVLERLAKYEELEEQGKLLKLPCAVGDRLYRIDTDKNVKDKEIEIFDIDNILVCNDGAVFFKCDAYDGVICELENIITDKPYFYYYRIFLTESEAAAALQALKEREI